MQFDMTTLFEAAENVLTELDEGSDIAGVDFARRIFSMQASCHEHNAFYLYQKDAVVRYVQWFLTCNRELGVDSCVDALYQHASQFWDSDTPSMTEDMAEKVFQIVNSLFPYSKKVLGTRPIDLLLMDAQHVRVNGETSAVFTPDGMWGCICMYRMQDDTTAPVHVLLHELGHLLHVKATGTLTELPDTFRAYLSELGTEHERLTIFQLQDVFADTFMLAVISKHPELGIPVPGISEKALAACYKYICTFFYDMK